MLRRATAAALFALLAAPAWAADAGKPDQPVPAKADAGKPTPAPAKADSRKAEEVKPGPAAEHAKTEPTFRETLLEIGYTAPLGVEDTMKLLGSFDANVLSSHARPTGNGGAVSVLVVDHPAGRFLCEHGSRTNKEIKTGRPFGPAYLTFTCWPFPGVKLDEKSFEPRGAVK